MKRKLSGFFIFSVMVIFFHVSPLFSANNITLVLGEVYIQHYGEKIQARAGMTVSGNDYIITKRNGRVSIHNTETGSVFNVGPGKKIALKKLSSSLGSRSSWFRYFRKNYRKTVPTATAGVRGDEEGKIKISWDDSDDEKPDRSHAWELYKKGSFSKVYRLTKDAHDDEGIFLTAASLYFIHGISREKKILKDLKKVQGISTNKKLLYESRRLYAIILFETGRYDASLKLLTQNIRYRKESAIGDLSYYMLVLGCRYTGNSEKEKYYKRKMRKYHSKSPLYNKLQGSL